MNLERGGGGGDKHATRRIDVEVEINDENLGERNENLGKCLNGSYTRGSWKLAPDPFRLAKCYY